jgi:hypothetical protein
VHAAKVASWIPYLPTPDLSHWYHLSTEREARIIAKRVAESIFGKSAVDDHIGTMAQLAASSEDAADWDFIRTLASDQDYDLKTATIHPVAKTPQRIGSHSALNVL